MSNGLNKHIMAKARKGNIKTDAVNLSDKNTTQTKTAVKKSKPTATVKSDKKSTDMSKEKKESKEKDLIKSKFLEEKRAVEAARKMDEKNRKQLKKEAKAKEKADKKAAEKLAKEEESSMEKLPEASEHKKVKKEKSEKVKKEKPKKPEEKFLLEIASNVQAMRDAILQSRQQSELSDCAPGVVSIGNATIFTVNISGWSEAAQQTEKFRARRIAYQTALNDLYVNANLQCSIGQEQECESNKTCQAVLDGRITIRENPPEEKMQWHDEHGNHVLVFQYKYVLTAAFNCRCRYNY